MTQPDDAPRTLNETPKHRARAAWVDAFVILFYLGLFLVICAGLFLIAMLFVY